ncbi:hypothetical protein FZEAL_1775 [Fusarium zealandicum]|uniref:Uncharacterized protein n=1 Tax=Fusarium zealandicum TaxID=1053134 RepID=A0A8H4US41_9HYPO|nr:hypothetical protein FZEAL_1775 [Fusarium zealandicum]
MKPAMLIRQRSLHRFTLSPRTGSHSARRPQSERPPLGLNWSYGLHPLEANSTEAYTAFDPVNGAGSQIYILLEAYARQHLSIPQIPQIPHRHVATSRFMRHRPAWVAQQDPGSRTQLRLASAGNHYAGLLHTLAVSPPRSEASTYLAQVSVSWPDHCCPLIGLAPGKGRRSAAAVQGFASRTVSSGGELLPWPFREPFTQYGVVRWVGLETRGQGTQRPHPFLARTPGHLHHCAGFVMVFAGRAAVVL